MSPEVFADISASAFATFVTRRTFSQTFSNIVDQQTQSGVFYTDGHRAWVTENFRGRQGTHHCSADYALGHAIEEKDCSESGTLSRRDLYMRWHISVIASAGQVNGDESHTLHVNAAGRIWQ